MNDWMMIEEYEKLNPEGLGNVVMIKYKRQVCTAYYRDGTFYFNAHTNACYMSECITGVKFMLFTE